MTKSGCEMNITEYIYSKDAEDRFDFESHVFDSVFDKFCKNLPTPEEHENDIHNAIDVWFSEVSGEIMCRTEELAKMILNIIRDISGEHFEGEYGYYDPKMDEQSDCVDDRTGWWAISFE